MSGERCECGHPEDAHPMAKDEHGTFRLTPCRATVYEDVPNGMNAWPCPCRQFRAVEGTQE